MSLSFDVCALGNAIVDVIAPCDDSFLIQNGIAKGGMGLIDQIKAEDLQRRVQGGLRRSGGSAANTMAGIASFGGAAAFMGKVADDELGRAFSHDMQDIGVYFSPAFAKEGEPTARCFSFVTPDAQRSMCTYLGAAADFNEGDIIREIIEGARVTYLEGYLFDRPAAQAAFKEAARVAKQAGKKLALTLSDLFCVKRHRMAFLDLIKQQVDVLFANEVEIMACYQTDNFDMAVSMAGIDCPLVVVTRSEKGCVIVDHGSKMICRAVKPKELVDTTGAGDLFAAGFLFGWTRDKSLEECAHLGAVAAAEIIGHAGARPEVSLKTLI